MRGIALFLALLLQGAPADEYKTKLAQLSKNTAAKHYSVGDYLATAQMHLWARAEFNKTLEFDPDHEGARRKLGYKKADGGWENDPTIKQEFANKKKGEDAERIRKQYLEKLETLGRDLSRQWTDLGLYCKRNSLPKEAEHAFRKALEYDPANATVRKELGYEKDAKGVWISKAERELRKEMKDGIAKAPEGAVSGVTTPAEEKLGIKHTKRESGHYLIESPHLKDKELADLVQHAEHAYAMFHKIFGESDLYGGRKHTYVILKDKAQHERFIDLFHQGTPAQKDLAKKSSGFGAFPFSETVQDTRPIGSLQDMVVHVVAESLTEILVGTRENHWLNEGVAYHFTRLMKDSAGTYCVDLAGTGPKSDGKSYQEAANWPIVCKVWVREGKDPNIDEILKCTNIAELSGAETVKAWSLVDFLMAEHRDKLIELCKALREKKPIEEALRSVWGWSTGDLDFRWKQFVRVSY
jgi:hypothetical protein